MSTYLGKPNHKVEEYIKDQQCDIFIKEDGTKVRQSYDTSKTLLNIYDVDDYENVRQFSFGKSYTEIDNLYYYDKAHGIDLSRTKIDETSFYSLYLDNNQLTSFSLPASLTSFSFLYLNNKQYGSDEPFILDMKHIEDASKIPTCTNKIYGENLNTYVGTILIRASLLDAFKSKWGNDYNYQGV